MLPSNQRLETRNLAGRHIDLRLVVQTEFVALEGVAQTRLQRHSALDLGVHLRSVDLEIIPALVLCAVHRHVSVLQQRIGIASVRRVETQADAAGDMNVSAIDNILADDRAQSALHDL